MIFLVLTFSFFCSLFSEKSAVSHSITWRNPVSVKRVDISGSTAYAVSGRVPNTLDFSVPVMFFCFGSHLQFNLCRSALLPSSSTDLTDDPILKKKWVLFHD